jgi:SOS response regulatory protein OraA/RecX
MRRIHEAYGLDDGRFARSYVHRRAATRGPMAIAGELAARGIDRAAAEAALAEFGPAEQLNSAIRLAFRLYARGPDLAYREVVDKIGTKLMRRGFSITTARAACRAVLAGASQPPED